jgi:hypothetical protein
MHFKARLTRKLSKKIDLIEYSVQVFKCRDMAEAIHWMISKDRKNEWENFSFKISFHWYHMNPKCLNQKGST